MAGGAADCTYWERVLSKQCRLYELRYQWGLVFIPCIFIVGVTDFESQKDAKFFSRSWIGLDPASDPPSANVWIRIRIKRCRSEAFLFLHCIKRPDVSPFCLLDSCLGPKSDRDPLSVADPDAGSGMKIPCHISESLETIFWVKNT